MRILHPWYSGTPTVNRPIPGGSRINCAADRADCGKVTRFCGGCRLEIGLSSKFRNVVLAAIAGVGLLGRTGALLSLLIVNTHLFSRPAHRVDDLVICLAIIEI